MFRELNAVEFPKHRHYRIAVLPGVTTIVFRPPTLMLSGQSAFDGSIRQIAWASSGSATSALTPLGSDTLIS